MLFKTKVYYKTKQNLQIYSEKLKVERCNNIRFTFPTTFQCCLFVSGVKCQWFKVNGAYGILRLKEDVWIEDKGAKSEITSFVNEPLLNTHLKY